MFAVFEWHAWKLALIQEYDHYIQIQFDGQIPIYKKYK